MGESTRSLKGVFKDGLIVPDPGMVFNDGTPVAFHALPMAFTAEEQAEFDAWDRLSAGAWATIDWGEGEIARDSG